MSRWGPHDNPEAHLPALRRYARALTQDAAAADDLVQQALLRAWERGETFRPGASLRAWLFAILHNQFVSGQRRQRVEQQALATLAVHGAEDSEGGQEAHAQLAEVAGRFAALPEGQRAVLHLIAIEGLSYEQAAAALNVPVGTIMSRLSRARATLRRDPASPRPLHIIGGKDARGHGD